MLKSKLFRQQSNIVCNRLLSKMDTGFRIGQMKEFENEAFLDDHPRGFKRIGNQMDYYNWSSNGLRSNSPSAHMLFENHMSRVSALQRTSHTKNRTELPTNRKSKSRQHAKIGSLDLIKFKTDEFKNEFKFKEHVNSVDDLMVNNFNAD